MRLRLAAFQCLGPAAFLLCSASAWSSTFTVKATLDGSNNVNCSYRRKGENSDQDCTSTAISGISKGDKFKFVGINLPWCVEFKGKDGTLHSPFRDNNGNQIVRLCRDPDTTDGGPDSNGRLSVATDCTTAGSPPCTYNFFLRMVKGDTEYSSRDPQIIVDPGGGGRGRKPSSPNAPKKGTGYSKPGTQSPNKSPDH